MQGQGLARYDVVMRQMTIGGLARAAEVPISTVRYYERAGLLTTTRRSASNYRLYTDEDAQRLRFIKAAQATGFSLDDVSRLLRPAPCGLVQGLIEARLADVSARMRELRHVKRVLSAALIQCREHERSGRCKVVDDLTVAARSSAQSSR